MTNFTVIRKHEIHMGHRIHGHQGKCQNLHGHSYIMHFYYQAVQLNNLGMVIDFDIIKGTMCKWLDDNYDHRLLIWQNDPLAVQLQQLDKSVVITPYNPSAENIANYLLNEIAPKLTGIPKEVTLYRIIVEETSKCQAQAALRE